jgi:hypothetical protein
MSVGYRSLFRANDKWLYRPSLAPSLFLDRFFETLAWWRSDPELRVIHIVRTDNLAWLRSKFVAKELDSFGAGNAYSSDVKITIPASAAVRRIRMKHWLDSELGKLHLTNPYHVVCYEDLLKDRNAVISGAQQFLGFDAELMPEEMVRKRQSKGIPISDHLKNYDEISRLLERENLVTESLPGLESRT